MAEADLLLVLPVGVVLRRGDALVSNPAAQALTGYGAGELDHIDRWFEHMFGEEAPRQRAFYERYRSQGFPTRPTLRLRRKDGTLCFVEVAARLLEDGQEVWTLHDITERHQADERFRVLFEQSTDAHLLFDKTGIIDCNQAAVDMLRCRDKKQLLATHPAVFSPPIQPDGRSSHEKSIEMDSIARRDGIHRFDWIHRKLDGTDFPVEVTLNPVVLAGGPALLVVWHDLTQRKEIERALAEARDKALEATRAKSAFLANMSHELRTPLNAIIGYSELLLEDAANSAPESVEDLAKISGAGRHLLTLINDILDLSKIEAGFLKLHREWIDVTEMAQEVVQTVSPMAARNGNLVSIEVDPNVTRICADMTRVRQILLNLMGNASKFTHNGQLGLRVRRQQRQGVPWLAFEVWDTGIGIPQDLLSHIFDEFVQGDASTTRKFGGTGLGLAITKRLCELMGGEIAVSSVPGQGSTFVVSMPVEVVGPIERATPQSLPPLSEEALALPADAPLVVVIDDDLYAQELMRRTLARGGFRSVPATDGATGLALCRQRKPAAVTLDVLMPGHDGWQVLTALKADPELSSIPVVMVSVLHDRPKGFALGASHYLTKPIDRNELISTLERYRPLDAPGTALVVEDNDALRVLMERSLTRSGWTVHQARNGAEALEILAQHPPDIVLLDLMMPVMDGFDFLATVRSQPQWQRLPVIVVTARELSSEERARLEGQAQRVLEKGLVSPEALLHQVAVAVRSCAPVP
jgi:PAS domain S-box-containing protein